MVTLTTPWGRWRYIPTSCCQPTSRRTKAEVGSSWRTLVAGLFSRPRYRLLARR